jgi:hypothetical protein
MVDEKTCFVVIRFDLPRIRLLGRSIEIIFAKVENTLKTVGFSSGGTLLAKI